MKLEDIFVKDSEESEFYRLAKSLVEPSDIKLLTDIDKASIFATAHLYADFCSRYFNTNAFSTFLINYYRLRISNKREGRKEIIEVSKKQDHESEQ